MKKAIYKRLGGRRADYLALCAELEKATGWPILPGEVHRYEELERAEWCGASDQRAAIRAAEREIRELAS